MSVRDHVLVNVLVSDLRLLVLDPDRVQSLIQAEVRHDRGDDLVIREEAFLLHVQAADVDDVVAGHDVPLLIHAQAAVRVSVVREADVQPVLHDELLQVLDVRRAAVGIDIIAVGLRVHDEGLRAERVEHALRDRPGSAVRAVQAHLHVLKAEARKRDQVADVAVPARHVVHGAADVRALRERHLDLSVDVLLDLQERLLVHLLAVAVYDLNSVIVIRVVRSRDHDAAVEVVRAGNVGNGRRRRHVHDVGVRARGHQARAERVLEHVRRSSGVLADHDLRLTALARAEVPADEAADLDRVLIVQRQVRFPAEAVGSEIFTHSSPPVILDRCVGGLQPFLTLNVEEILIRVHGQLAAGLLVAGNDRRVMQLQRRAGPLLAHAALDGRGQCAGLIMA